MALEVKDVGLRLPLDMHEKLKASAKKNRRSINNEIIIALELLFGAEDEKRGSNFTETNQKSETISTEAR